MLQRTPLKRKTGLKARKRTGLERHIPLKAKLERHTRLKPVSEKQKAKNELWARITNERCYELGFICLWCGQPGQRNDPTRWDYLDGHHTRKPRYSHNDKGYCYPAHRSPCHREIEDNNIDVEKYPNKEIWLAQDFKPKEAQDG